MSQAPHAKERNTRDPYMLRDKKGWGGRSAWAQSFFDMVHPSLIPGSGSSNSNKTDADHTTTTTARSSSSSFPAEPSGTKSASSPKQVATTAKTRKHLEQDPLTQWRCRRCHALLHPPLDVATKKPRHGVMMCEHLEGISSGGTTRLATGVTVCAAGTLRYDKQAAAAAMHNSDSAEGSVRVDEGAGTQRSGSAAPPLSAAREAARQGVVDLLRVCQRAALAECAAGRPPVPLVFVVVENPKTPANAGGILRAMRCYGVHGPAASSPTADNDHSTEKAPASPSSSPSFPSLESDGVRQRVGGFIFSGTRLRAAMAHSEASRTDPTHAGRDIPQLCLPVLDDLFAVLRSAFGHHHVAASAPSLVRVVAVELVEGATPLPAFAHPFSNQHPAPPSVSAPVDATAATSPQESLYSVPMVFYVFGAEDGTLSAHHLEHDVDDVVFMPTTGSMNLAATVNVLLYDRVAKECCGLQPAAGEAAAAERQAGQKWKEVFASRNTNNRTRWTRPT